MRILRLLDKWDVTVPMTGEWIALACQDGAAAGRILKAVSLQLSYSGVSGFSPGGFVDIEGSNDGIAVCHKKRMKIDSSSNVNDALLLVFNHVFHSFRIRFSPGTLGAGTLDAVLLLK